MSKPNIGEALLAFARLKVRHEHLHPGAPLAQDLKSMEEALKKASEALAEHGYCESGTQNYNGKAVHRHEDGTWYFWDETWATEHGPYATQALADEGISRYIEEELEGPRRG